MREAAAQGYAIDDEETRQGMVCIGAPIFSAAFNEAGAAVAVSLPKSTLRSERKALAILTVTQLACHMSQRLGWRRSDADGDSGHGNVHRDGDRLVCTRPA